MQTLEQNSNPVRQSATPDLYLCQFGRKIALRTTRAFVDGFSERLLPVFDNIDNDAHAAAEKAWDDAMSSPAVHDSFDPGDFAEAAQEYGLEVYENLHFARQQLLGLAAAGIYHLWERLLKQFLCKELTGWIINDRPSRQTIVAANFADLEKLLSEFGFDLKQQPYYRDLTQLRLVANVVKHGDGKSCDELQAEVLHLFEGYTYNLDISSQADKLDLKAADFARYAQAVTDFWSAFPERLTAGASA